MGRFPISGLTDEQLSRLENQFENSSANSRSEYLRRLIDILSDERLTSISRDPLVAVEQLIDNVAPVDATVYDPAEGVAGTLERETVYDILEFYDAPGLRSKDIDEESLPGKTGAKADALAAVARWEFDPSSKPERTSAGRMAIKSTIRHPSDYLLDKYPKLVAKSLQSDGTAADNTLKGMDPVHDWRKRVNAAETQLEGVMDGERDWNATRNTVERITDEGEVLLKNVWGNEEEIVRNELNRLEGRLDQIREEQHRADVEEKLKEIRSATNR